MDADREREIRELADRLLVSKRHRRIGIVLTDMLAEIDLLRAERDRDDPPMTMPMAEARCRIMGYAENVSDHVSAAVWGDIARECAGEYAMKSATLSEVSPSS